VPHSVSPITHSFNLVTVTVVRSQTTTVRGELGKKAVDVILDSGSSVSLVESNTLTGMKDVVSVRCARSLCKTDLLGPLYDLHSGYWQLLVNPADSVLSRPGYETV